MAINKIPLMAGAVAEKWAKESLVPKPTAFGTVFRYSGALGCTRRAAYDWFEAEYTEKPTPGRVVQAGVGTIFGEAQANAQIEKFGGRAEVPSQLNEFLSGSADWFGWLDEYEGFVVYENKLKSSFAFNMAVGVQRNFGKAKRIEPKGAPIEALVQAGMNALGIELTYALLPVNHIIVGVVTTEVLSVGMAESIDADDYEIFCVEETFTREEFEPLVKSEIDRLAIAYDVITMGNLPPRWVADTSLVEAHGVFDGFHNKEIEPEGSNWQCGYCPYRSLCVQDGSGYVRITESALIRRKTETEE